MAQAEDQEITIWAGDTEPLAVTVGARGQTDLTNLTTALAYFRKFGETTNHVDGVTCTVPDTADLVVELDPEGAGPSSGNAFEDEGVYLGYLKLTWSSGKVTRHPDDGEELAIKVKANFEG